MSHQIQRKEYATGNCGLGTEVYAFKTKAERDEFVAWNTNYAYRRAIKRSDARSYGKMAIVLESGEIVLIS